MTAADLSSTFIGSTSTTPESLYQDVQNRKQAIVELMRRVGQDGTLESTLSVEADQIAEQSTAIARALGVNVNYTPSPHIEADSSIREQITANLAEMRQAYLSLVEIAQRRNPAQTRSARTDVDPFVSSVKPWTLGEVLFVLAVIAILVVTVVIPAIRAESIRRAYASGSAAASAGNWEQALTEYAYAYENDPTNPEALNGYAGAFRGIIETRLDAGDWEGARGWSSRYAAALPNVPEDQERALNYRFESYYRPAQIAVDAGDWEEAREQLDALEGVRRQIGLTTSFGYSDSLLLYQTTLLEQARAATDAEQWTTAQPLLERLNEPALEPRGQAESDLKRRGSELLQRSYYEQAVDALKAEDWDGTRSFLTTLRTLNVNFVPNTSWGIGDPDYLPLSQMERESYYRPAVQFLNAAEYENARLLFDQLLQLDADQDTKYRSTVNLRLDTFYLPARAALDAGEWITARELYVAERQLIIDDYRSSRADLLLSYITVAEVLADAQDWINARNELLPYVALLQELELVDDPINAGMIDLLRSTYFIPAQTIAADGRWLDARAELQQYLDLDLEQSINDINFTNLLLDTHYYPAIAALESEQYSAAEREFTSPPLSTSDHREKAIWLSELYYRRAQGYIAVRDWIAARGQLESLLNVRPQGLFADAESLWLDTYLIPAEEALAAQDYDTVKTLTGQVLTQITVPQGEESRAALLRNEAYYRNASRLMAAGEWETARAEWDDLIALTRRSTAPYRDSVSLRLDTFYKPALVVYESAEAGTARWIDARSALEVPDLINASPAHRDAPVLRRETYYQPALAYLTASDWNSARAELIALRALDVDALGSGQAYKDTDEWLLTAYYEDARIQSEGGNWSEVQRLLEEVRTYGNFFADDDNSTDLLAQAYFELATAILAQPDGNYSEAIALLDKLEAIRPNYAGLDTLYVRASYVTAQQQMAAQNWEEARRLLNDIMARFELSGDDALDPVFDNASTLLRESYYAPAKIAFEQGDYAEAREGFAALVAALGDSGEEYKDARSMLYESVYALAAEYAENSDFDSARRSWEELQTLSPNYRDTLVRINEMYFRLAESALEEERWQTVRTWLQALAEREPNYPGAREMLLESRYRPASAAFAAEDWNAARTELSAYLALYNEIGVQRDARYIEVDEWLRQSYYTPGLRAYNAGSFAQARADLEQLPDLSYSFGGNPSACELIYTSYFDIGMAALSDGIWNTARTEFSGLLRNTAMSRTDWCAVPSRSTETVRLLNESYYRPAFLAVGSKDWALARSELAFLLNDPESAFFVPNADPFYGEVPLRSAILFQLDTFNIPAQEAFAAQDWGTARKNCELITRQEVPELPEGTAPEFAAFAAQQLEEINTIKSAARELYLQSYTVPGQAAFDRQDWTTARAIYMELLVAEPDNAAAKEMVRETYLLPIRQAIAAGVYAQARAQLDVFLQANPDERSVYDALTVVSYYVPLRNAIRNSDWITAADLYGALRLLPVADVQPETIGAEYPDLNAITTDDLNLERILLENTPLRIEFASRVDANLNAEPFPAHAAAVNAAAISPSGVYAVSAGNDGTLRVVSVSEQRTMLTISTGRAWVYAVAIDPLARWFVSASDEANARVWDRISGQNIAVLGDHAGTVGAIAISSDGGQVATGDSGGRVIIWNSSDWTAATTIETDAVVSALQFADAGLAVGTADGRVTVYSPAGEVQFTVQTATYVTEIVFNPLDGSFVTVGNSPVIEAWTADGTKIGEYTAHTDWVRSAVFTSDGRFLATVSADNILRLWTVSNRTVATTVDGLTDPRTVRFADGGVLFMVANGDGSLVISR